MLLTSQNPSIIQLGQLPDLHPEITASLTYSDKSAQFQLQRFKKNKYLADRMDPEKWSEHVEKLTQEAKPKSLVFQNEDGSWYTYSGFANYLAKKLRKPVENQVKYPAFKKLAWAEVPAFQMYPYQEQALEALLEAKHAGVEMGTGLGKSFIIQNLIRQTGLKTIVMTPSTSITEQLYEEFVKAFGKKLVGGFFGSKKDSKKLIVIANAQSLTNVTPGTKHWDDLSSVQTFIADESHQCPASTMASVCFGVAAKACYRWFFSATQMRNDGRDLLLDGITGPIVYRMTVREGVDQGFLSKPLFKMLKVGSSHPLVTDDANRMTRTHLYYNDEVVQKIATLVNGACNAGYPTLVLIEEVEQFSRLLPYLRFKAGFAHGPLNDDNRPKVPQPYWESDPSALVKEFNDGNLPCLVGTSCISTGTDVRAVKFLVYWQGGKSEIQVKQAVGRGTRKKPDGQNFCHVVDIDVENIKVLHRHAEARREIYNDLYGPVVDLAL
jgi:superfamily II DNA or RNA helicase